MDAFYASVEQRDRPELRGRPVAVGGSRRRGVVAAASYEARAFGVHSAMPSARASRLCPDLVFVPARFEVYAEISRTIRGIFRAYTDLVEPMSLDEAYLDVSFPKQGGEDAAAPEGASDPNAEASTAASSTAALDSARTIARRIKSDIQRATGLTASAGISFNKFLAKTASDFDKPDGLFVIGPEEAAAFLSTLPIERFHGVGRATAEKMKELGIYTGADLMARTEDELVLRFGKTGRFFHRIVRGEDSRAVQPHHVRKSVGAERTFMHDLRNPDQMFERLHELAARVGERMARIGVAGRTVTIKIKYHDFSITTRSTTLHRDVHHVEDLAAVAGKLLVKPEPERPVRLLGLAVSNLRPIAGARGSRQLTLALD